MPAGARADVEHPAARGHGVERELVAARVAELDVVVAVAVTVVQRLEPALVEHPQAVGDSLERRQQDVLGVPDAVDVADLVAVVRRDRHLDDPLPDVEQLDDDLGVEVEVVRVEREPDPPQRRHRVGAVAAVELGEPGAQQRVLHSGEESVADVLVERHPPAQRAERRHHPAAEHRVGAALLQRREQPRHLLGRVLAVAVEQDDDVEPALDRERVADLLVAAVALVQLVAQHGHPDLGVRLLVLAAQRVRPVFRRVVDDEDLAVVVVADLRRDALAARRSTSTRRSRRR